jgi:two-component system cell cycle sensor histidine kinase/response regulator CckA
MNRPLRVLIVEDSEDDSMRLVRELRRGGYDLTHERVEKAEAFKSALDEQSWDLIIADYNLPEFSAPAALALLKESGLDLPFIILSGVVSEAEAVAAMKAGAHDYIKKDTPARLIPAIERELREAEMRHERRRLQEAFRQSQKMEVIGRFAGEMVHEFNNALTVITGYSALLLSRLPDGAPMRREIEEIRTAAERAALLTHQLSAFSQRQALQPRVLDLNAVIGELREMLAHLLGKNVDLVTVLDPGLGRFEADRSQIEQVIMNLAVNARDAMPKGGTLTVETANAELDETYAHQYMKVPPGPYIMLALSDTGCGMDGATQARIFEPFFTTKPKDRGRGLGLSIVYGIVKQNAGDIRVRSAPGQGTTFAIYLPRVEEAAEPSPAQPTREAPAESAQTILLVDDEEKVRLLAHEILKGSGYTVLEARDGSAALLIGRRYSGPIHLLLTDVVIPDMSGRELLEQLERLRPEMRALYMSAHAGAEHRLVGRDFLQKPFTPELLTQKVSQVLQAPWPAHPA